MTSLAELERALVPPPADAPDVCPICRSWRGVAEPTCNNCTENTAILGESVRVVPVSLYSKPSQLRDWLTYYKPNPEEFRSEYREVVGQILVHWLSTHERQLRTWLGDFDSACVVPSRERQPPHPLESVIDEYVPPLARQRVALVERSEGTLGHRQPARDGYVADPSAQDRRVLLVDDVYTTGARSQSAAYSLRSVGAVVVAVLIVGRRINPAWRDEVDRLWQRQQEQPFRFDDDPWWWEAAAHNRP